MNLPLVQLVASALVLALVVIRGVYERRAIDSRPVRRDSLNLIYYGLLASSLGLIALSSLQLFESHPPTPQCTPCSTEPSLGYPPGPHSEATFSALLSQEAEMRGYGLYSYLLFGSVPTDDAARERYIAAITSISSLPSTRKMLLAKFGRDTLNITYLPLTTPVVIKSRPTDRSTAIALLNAYNYPRARFLIDKIDSKLKSGPYIISVLVPLGDTTSTPNKYLFQDLSSVTPRVVSTWVTIFQSEAAKEEFWEPETANRFAADLRSVIDIVAHQIMPNMPPKIAASIGWGEAPASKEP